VCNVSDNSPHHPSKPKSGLRGQDNAHGDLVDQTADPTQETRDGLRRERKGPVNRTTGRGNETPPPHVPQSGPVDK